MKRVDFRFWAGFLVLVLSVRAWATPGTIGDLLPRDADIVVDQQPTRTGGPASDTLFINRSGQVAWQQEADNITLTQPLTIGRIGWWGFYGTWNQTHMPPAMETFRIRLYDARGGGGLPGSTLFEQTFDAASRVATGRTVLAEEPCPEYFYQVDLSQGLTFEAGVMYWLEMVQLGDIDSHFRWEYSRAGDNASVFLNGNVLDWSVAPGGAALQLSAIPEPGSWFLFVSSLFLIQSWGGRRRGRG